MQHLQLKKYRFNKEKDLKLLEERNIGFQKVIDAIMEGKALDFKKHHNQKRYSHQNIIYVHIEDQVYAVPCVKEEKDGYFLKTIIPDSKMRDVFFSNKKKGEKS